MDTTSDPAHPQQGDCFESWPSLIHGSTSVLQADESHICYMMWASFAEIYKEQIFDLLDVSTASAARITRPSTLQLRERDGRPYISGLREVHVSSAEEALRLVQIGRHNQHIATTRLNRASSRSHSIFTLRLIQVADVDQPTHARVASLSFCDLAGSERNTACAGNERLKEANNINLSLMTLGRCMETLRKNQTRRDQSAVSRASIIVPFRDSKLTRMFQSFLCGEGRVIMITNVSPCANVFDETLHAVNYSAIASQVVVGPSAPQYANSSSILVMPTHGDKHKASILGKHEATAVTSKAVLEKKRKRDTIQEAENVEDNARQDVILEEDEDYSDEDVPDSWNDERQKLLSAIEKLQSALKSKTGLETQIRAEVCEEMQKQLVRIESEYQENFRKREEILEDKYDRKMEIYMEAVQKSCKRQRRGDDEDDDMSSVDRHAAEVRLSKKVEEVNELKKELSTARDNISKLSAERDAVAAKLTELEFSASDAFHQEKTQARAECAKLRQTVEEVTNKLSDAEHRHEVTCRQLRRDKAQLEQKLSEAEKMAKNHDHQPQNAGIMDSRFDKTDDKSLTDKITELEAALKKERDAVNDLEQQLKDAKVVEKTWAEHCKDVEAGCQEKTYELTKLREQYDVLEHNLQETVKTLEEAKQNHAQADEMLQTVRNELGDKEEQLKALTSVSESLKEEINRMTVESENERKNLMGELEAKEEECDKMKTDIADMKQQASDAVDGNQDNISATQHELDALREKLKQMEDEKAAAVESLNSEITKLTSQLLEEKDQLVDKMSEIGQLEKELETERESQCQLENTVAEYEKKLVESESHSSEERDKYLALQSSLETVQSELSLAEDACKRAEEEAADHLSTITSYEAKLKSSEAELDIMKEKLRNCDDREVHLKQQLSTSSELVNELQEKDKSRSAELANRDKKLQTCNKTINDLKQKITEEREKSESALNDAGAKEKVIEQMKLTMTEQEMAMQTQDEMLQERDSEVQSLKERLDQASADQQHQSESLNDQIRQKNTRIRELEKEMEKVRKSRECLEKDVRDITSELRTSEHDLAEVKKELASTKQELEKLKSDETSAKSLAKREMELSNLRKQLQMAQDKFQKCDNEMVKLNNHFHAFKVDKEKELSAWREKRDRLVAELEKTISEKDAELEHLKATGGHRTGRNRRDRQPSSEDGADQSEGLRKQVEQLQRAASAKDQTIVDMREQNLQLQHQICQLHHFSEADDNSHRRNTSRRSRIPTSQRMPLRITDGNSDMLADSGMAVDLDETSADTRKRRTRRYDATHENSQPRQSEVEEQFARPTNRTRRKRTTAAVDPMESTITEEPESLSQARRLRSSRHY